jgi:hypothetical protein
LKKRVLKKYVRIYTDVGGGGDCAFKSIALTVFGYVNKQKEVREIAAKTMVDHLPEYAKWHFTSEEEMLARADSLLKCGTWTNWENDLWFTAIGLGLCIFVIGPTHTDVIGDEASAKRVVYMAHIPDFHFAAACKVDPARVPEFLSALDKEVCYYVRCFPLSVTLLHPGQIPLFVRSSTTKKERRVHGFLLHRYSSTNELSSRI